MRSPRCAEALAQIAGGQQTIAPIPAAQNQDVYIAGKLPMLKPVVKQMNAKLVLIRIFGLCIGFRKQALEAEADRGQFGVEAGIVFAHLPVHAHLLQLHVELKDLFEQVCWRLAICRLANASARPDKGRSSHAMTAEIFPSPSKMLNTASIALS